MTLDWSGGIAGVQRSLEVSSSGQVIARDLDASIEESAMLATDELAALTDLLAEACPFAGTGRPPPCADCYQYAWSLETDGRPVAGIENDVSLRDSPLGHWIGALISLWQSAIAGESGKP